MNNRQKQPSPALCRIDAERHAIFPQNIAQDSALSQNSPVPQPRRKAVPFLLKLLIYALGGVDRKI